MNALKRFLTLQEVCELLGVTRQHIRNLISRGKLSHTKIGRSVRFNPDTLQIELEQLTQFSVTHEVAKNASKRSSTK